MFGVDRTKLEEHECSIEFIKEDIRKLKEAVFYRSKDIYAEEFTNVKEVLSNLIVALGLKVDYHEPTPGRIEVVAALPAPTASAAHAAVKK